jgi:bifunctional oligoribonuclease and PAP phosphatase NrnA
MQIEQKHLQALQTIASSAQRIVCICHQNPDGDAIGSVLGLQQLLASAYSAIPVIAYCIDSAPSAFVYMPLEHLQSVLVPQKNDVYIFVDTATSKLTGLETVFPQLFTKEYLTISIDHHVSNTQFADLNIICPEVASTCEIILELASSCNWYITPQIATCLYTGLLTDTGGFLHSNTSAYTYRNAAQLVRLGAAQNTVITNVFRTAKVSTLRLWGRVLEKIQITPEGGAISAVTKRDFAATNADYTELTGAIDYLNSVPGMRFSLLLSERDGKVKGSLRTLRDDIDVAKMANVFQGGGHTKAAGFSVEGALTTDTRYGVQPTDSSTT